MELHARHRATGFKIKDNRGTGGRTNRFGFPLEMTASKIVDDARDDTTASMDTPGFLGPLLDVSFTTPVKADVVGGHSTPSAPFTARGDEDRFRRRDSPHHPRI